MKSVFVKCHFAQLFRTRKVFKKDKSRSLSARERCGMMKMSSFLRFTAKLIANWRRILTVSFFVCTCVCFIAVFKWRLDALFIFPALIFKLIIIPRLSIMALLLFAIWINSLITLTQRWECLPCWLFRKLKRLCAHQHLSRQLKGHGDWETPLRKFTSLIKAAFRVSANKVPRGKWVLWVWWGWRSKANRANSIRKMWKSGDLFSF